MNQNNPKKQTPIIFQPWKIEKILAWDFASYGPMQTRRLAKIPATIRQNLFTPAQESAGLWTFPSIEAGSGGFSLRSPYGSAGDSLWVKENWAARPSWDSYKPSEITIARNSMPGSLHPLGAAIFYQTGDPNWTSQARGKLRTSLFMPQAASRIKLRILEIHPERLFSIKESDAIPEGWGGETSIPSYSPFYSEAGRQWYFNLWDKLNGDKKPATLSKNNPWVWKITFERIR